MAAPLVCLMCLLMGVGPVPNAAASAFLFHLSSFCCILSSHSLSFCSSADHLVYLFSVSIPLIVGSSFSSSHPEKEGKKLIKACDIHCVTIEITINATAINT